MPFGAKKELMTPGLIDILFEDDFLLVLAKPSGLSTQAPAGIDSLETRAKYVLKQREHARDEVYLGVPHRLDRPTSGVLLFAKMRRAARKISKQFERRTVSKVYWAWLAGTLADPDGTWRDHVRKVPDAPQGEVVPAGHADAKLGVLHYQTLATCGAATLVQIRLESGRFHQIRIQAAHRNHAVLGDTLYESALPFGPDCLDARQARHCPACQRADAHASQNQAGSDVCGPASSNLEHLARSSRSCQFSVPMKPMLW